MNTRSTGVTVLAFSTVMVAIFSQYAAISLLLSGSVSAAGSPIEAALTLVTGVIFLGLTVAGYVAGFGLWARRAFAWRTAAAVYVVLVVASTSLSILATDLATAIVISFAALVALVYLRKPAVRFEITGNHAAQPTIATLADGLEAAEPIR